MAYAPSNEMVGAGLVAADAEATYPLAVQIKSETSAEHVHAADRSADHRVIRLPVSRGIIGHSISLQISVGRIDRIAELKAIEAAARLHGGIKICCRQRKAGRKQTRRWWA